MKNKIGKSNPMMWVVAISLIALVAMSAYVIFGARQSQTELNAGSNVDTNTGSVNAAVNPAATYATQDIFGTTAVSGTSYYKRDGDSASTTAIANVNPGVEYTYWVQNTSTYYVKPDKFTAQLLNNNVLNKNAYVNGSATLNVINRRTGQVTTGTNDNFTSSANTVHQIEIRFSGTNKQSAAPFGGALVVEANSSITVSCSGTGIGNPTDYLGNVVTPKVTYTPSSVTHVGNVFPLVTAFDDGKGTTQSINCDLQEGATAAGTADTLTFKIIPANYYVGNDGQFYLDTEQAKNSANTRTGLGYVTKVVTLQ